MTFYFQLIKKLILFCAIWKGLEQAFKQTQSQKNHISFWLFAILIGYASVNITILL